MALIPHSHELIDQGFGIQFIRQPLMYIEPTDTWFYMVGLFSIAVADVGLAFRGACVALLGAALVLSFSVAGIIATLLALLICGAAFVGGRGLALVLVLGGGIALMVLPVDQLVA